MNGARDAWLVRVCRVGARVIATTVLAASIVSPLRAQQPSGAIRVELAAEPSSVTVGEPFHSAIRVVPPPGYVVRYGELTGGDTIQAIEPRRLTASADSVATAVYALVAWVAGTPLSATVDVTFVAPDGTETLRPVRLRLPEVVSVLPASGEEVVPRPPHGPIDPPAAGWPWWWWLVVLLGTLLAAWIGYRALVAEAMAEEPIDPRQWALQQLDRGAARLLHMGDLAMLFQRVSWVLRTYLQLVDPTLGRDLTTTELLDRLRQSDADAALTRQLEALLLAADRVKFARHVSAAADATAYLQDSRRWVVDFPRAETEPGAREAA